MNKQTIMRTERREIGAVRCGGMGRFATVFAGILLFGTSCPGWAQVRVNTNASIELFGGSASGLLTDPFLRDARSEIEGPGSSHAVSAASADLVHGRLTVAAHACNTNYETGNFGRAEADAIAGFNGVRLLVVAPEFSLGTPVNVDLLIAFGIRSRAIDSEMIGLQNSVGLSVEASLNGPSVSYAGRFGYSHRADEDDQRRSGTLTDEEANRIRLTLTVGSVYFFNFTAAASADMHNATAFTLTNVDIEAVAVFAFAPSSGVSVVNQGTMTPVPGAEAAERSVVLEQIPSRLSEPVLLPEPGSGLLIGGGLVALCIILRKRWRACPK